MTGDPPINLNRARKAKIRTSAAEQAARNRVAHGRMRAEKAAAAEALRLAELRLDGARREP